MIGIGTQIRRPMAQPANNIAGSPLIYYSAQPYMQPSITPPSINLLPSFGYSTGLYFPPTNFRPPTGTGFARGNLGYSPPVYNYVAPTYYYQPPRVVNQYYYSPPPVYNYTTNIAPQPRLSHGLLNN